METEQIVEQLRPWLNWHRRPAWRPDVEHGDGLIAASKFAGRPWLAAGMAWPACGHCQTPMAMFLQLNLDQLPAALKHHFGGGLLQLFYCTDCDDAWAPWSISSLVRVVEPQGTAAEPELPDQARPFSPISIVGWAEIADFPDPSEHQELGLIYTYDWAAATVRLDCPALGLALDGITDDDLAERISSAESGDKLAGWPHWIQGVEYAACPQCRRRMDIVFQLASNDHLPFMFGDLGTGHITQCPEHRAVVAFGWACH